MRSRLTYSNVISTAALFLALAGTATATSLITGQRGPSSRHSMASPPRAVAAGAVSLFVETRTGDRVTGTGGQRTATVTCPDGQIPLAGSADRRGGFNGQPTVAVEYAARRVTVSASMANGGESWIQAIAQCVGAR
jgi:hypothetical protein